MALTKVTEGIRTLGTGEVTTANMAIDPTNASNLTSGSVPLAQLGNAPSTDTTNIEADIALLGFKVAVNGDMGKYNLVDQTEDAFVDATGIDASASTNEVRNAAGYYSGSSTASVTASGGTESVVGAYTFHYFTADGNFITDTTQPIEVLLVAGGGGGGKHSGAGGGGGGLVYQASRSIASGTHAFVRGNGGAGWHTGSYPADSGGTGATGQDSTFNGLTARGGGGGSSGGAGTAAGVGGSGGGGSRGSIAGASANQSSQAGDSGTYGFGFAGGGGSHTGVPYPASGGGGAGAVGGNVTSTHAGAGGIGKYIAAFAAFGDSGYFAGGGGGQVQDNGNYGAGGTGGGARGGNNTSGDDGMGRNGTANTGGGGGGSQYNGSPSSNTATGGSGTLILKRSTLAETATNMTLISNPTTAQTEPTNGNIVLTYTDGVGTATVNTDLKAYCSRDNGVTYTQMTLAAKGTTGGHTILSANSVNISGQPSGSAMRYKIETLNQSAAKDTRIQAVSLGWS